MANNIAEIFSLQGLKVTVIATTETTIKLTARSPRDTADCPNCGTGCHRIHQNRQRIVKHGPLNDKLIVIKVFVRRFLYKRCCRTFTEMLPSISRRLSTKHCLQHQLEDASTTSIKGTAKKHNVAWASVASLLDDIHYKID